jgi:hypothetical protein
VMSADAVMSAYDPKRTIRDVRVMSEAQRRITWLLNSR